MAKYRHYSDFTAQGFNVKSLMRLYADLEKSDQKNPNLTPFVVFMAFSIESYLNSLGARHLEIWDELERLPWRSKVEILHKTAGLEAKWGESPLQFATEVFKLRDRLAHGKPELVVGPWADEEDEVVEGIRAGALLPDWYKGITLAWVLSAKDRFRVLMAYLGGLFNLPESDHLALSSCGLHFDDEADA